MVSVILPAYNAEKYIADSIKSVISQSFTDWELLIVDDGSTDSTPRLCDGFASSDPRIRVFHRHNAGVSAARNFGLDSAQGEYITFLDADDILHPEFLSSLIAPLLSSGENVSPALPPLMSATPFISFTVAPPSPSPSPLHTPATLPLPLSASIQALFYQTPVVGRHILDTSVWGKIYHRSLWHDLRFRENIRFEDLDIFYRLLLRAGDIAFVPFPLIGYRLNPESFIHTFSAARLDVLDVTDRILTDLSPLGPEFERAARTRRFAAHFNILLLLLSSRHDDPESVGRCMNVIMHEKKQVLRNPSARLKDRLGAFLACLGKHAIRLAARIF